MSKGVKILRKDIFTKSNSSGAESNRSKFSASKNDNFEPLNPLLIPKRQEFHHPYATQQSFMEKWQDLIHDCAESAWFIVYDAISYILDKIWQAFVALICFPIGMLGYVFDRLRTWVEKVSKFCLISSVSKENEMSRESD